MSGSSSVASMELDAPLELPARLMCWIAIDTPRFSWPCSLGTCAVRLPLGVAFTMERLLSLIRQQSKTHVFARPKERVLFFVSPVPPPPGAVRRMHLKKNGALQLVQNLCHGVVWAPPEFDLCDFVFAGPEPLEQYPRNRKTSQFIAR